MRKHFGFLGVVLSCVVLGVACAPAVAPGAPTETVEPVQHRERITPTIDESPLSEEMAVESPLTTPGQVPGSSMPVVPEEAQAVVEQATTNLVERLHLNLAEVELVGVEPVEWNDTSLGCPKEGQMYAQVITPGYRLVFETPAGLKEYHTNRGDRVVFCESGRSQPVFRDFPSDEASVEAAKADLAQRLAISIEQIEVVGVIGQDFTLDTFSCQPTREEGHIARDESPTRPGKTILLEANGKRYEYHANDKQVIFCRTLS